MLSTDIFEFEFVDRIDERKIIDDFLINNYHVALWLHGERGIGKSFLLKQHIITKENFLNIYVNIEGNNISSESYLKEFIICLNNVANLKFMNYLCSNYEIITAIGQKIFDKALNTMNLENSGLEELGCLVTNFFVSRQGEKENILLVLKKYIFKILDKYNKIVFIFDNFSQCDSVSLDILVSLIHELLPQEEMRFILCSTDSDLEDRSDIKETLLKVPNNYVPLKPFREKNLFARMLENVLELNTSNMKLLSQAFELCRGIPQLFKEFLLNLYSLDGIIIEEYRARFVPTIFQQLLMKSEISFDIDLFCRNSKTYKILLSVVTIWGEPISYKVLFEFLHYLSYAEPNTIIDEKLNLALQELEELQILNKIYPKQLISYQDCIFQFKHDSLRIAMNEYFKNDSFIEFLHLSIYEYLRTLENIENDCYWKQHYNSLLAYHSFAARIDKWIEFNYKYGYSFFNNQMYNEAERIFSRLETEVVSLSGTQLLNIGITLFYCGNYPKANNILSNIQIQKLIDDLSIEQKIKMYLFRARAESCMLNSGEALKQIEEAKKLNTTDESLRLLLSGAEQSILFLSSEPNSFQQAKEIFDKLTKEDIDNSKMALIYQSAMDYYEGEEALTFLNKGLNIAKKYSDEVTKAKILNNIGFENLRCSKYTEARKFFNDSIKSLKNFQPHEQVYPYSNLAVLEMIEGNWEQALDNIIEALFWNKSEYASLVLKTNRMLCYYFTNNSEWEKLYKELIKHINYGYSIDNKIYKKISINLALIAFKNNNINDALNILEKCQSHLISEWNHGKYRFFKLYQQITNKEVQLIEPPDAKQIQYYCTIEFEPWLINFSHD